MKKFKGEPIMAEPEWFRRAAQMIARQGKNLAVAVLELGIDGLTAKEVQDIYNSNTFQAILRNERLRYATEIGRDPQLSKDAAIGMMIMAIEKLIAESEWEKALEGVSKLSKLAGWIGADQTVNVFADLKQKDYEELKKQIELRKGKQGASETYN